MRIAAKEAAPGIAALALVAATVAALSGERTLYGDPTGDVPLEMPEQLGPWTGEAVWFCQNDQCARSFPESELDARAAGENGGGEAAPAGGEGTAEGGANLKRGDGRRWRPQIAACARQSA